MCESASTNGTRSKNGVSAVRCDTNKQKIHNNMTCAHHCVLTARSPIHCTCFHRLLPQWWRGWDRHERRWHRVLRRAQIFVGGRISSLLSTTHRCQYGPMSLAPWRRRKELRSLTLEIRTGRRDYLPHRCAVGCWLPFGTTFLRCEAMKKWHVVVVVSFGPFSTVWISLCCAVCT